MNSSSFSQEDVLNQLDASAHTGHFPNLDNGYIYPADTRLSAYGDKIRWAIVIEVLGMDVRSGDHDSIENRVYCFGNCLTHVSGITSSLILHPTTDGPDGPTFTEHNAWQVSTEAQTVRIRNIIVPISAKQAAWEARGIVLTKPPHLMAADLVRGLVLDYRDLLFATEDELRRWVPPDLPLLLRLDSWYHPDLMNSEMPSDTETFQMIADVLVTGDPSMYHLLRAPNTHWSHWRDAGTL